MVVLTLSGITVALMTLPNLIGILLLHREVKNSVKEYWRRMKDPGAKGIGDTAIRNYDKWKEIRVQMDTLVEKRPIDTSLSLFGKNFQYPFFAGPVGAVNMHYGDSLNDVSYNDILVSSCAEFGIAAFTGDGMDSNVMVAATEAIKKAGGLGIPTVKPWNVAMIREKMALVKDADAFAVIPTSTAAEPNFFGICGIIICGAEQK